MVGVFPEPFFASRESLEMPPGRLCASLLQMLTQGMEALPRLLNGLPTERFTKAVSSQVDDAKIDAECACDFIGHRFRNIQCHRQVERAVAIEQIGLPFDGIHAGLLIGTETEWDKHTARERQERDGINALKVHDALVIHHGSLWPERRLDALISLVGFTGLADAPDSQLSSKFVRGTQLAIHQLLQRKFVGCLFSKGDISYVVGSLIECVHGVKQSLGLFRCRSKFQEHRLFHRTSVHPLIEVVNRHGSHPTPAPNKVGPFLPRMNDGGILGRFGEEKILWLITYKTMRV